MIDKNRTNFKFLKLYTYIKTLIIVDPHLNNNNNNNNSINSNAVAGENGVRFLFLSAKPLREPIVQHGPFVMNTQKEIQQAFFDYQMGRY
ncbi:hypothetical protein ACTFIT_011115 [Dictyostelium discoideum]